MDSLNLVWNMIGAFFSALPPDVVMVATLAFMGAVILGFLGWLK